jgi:hypothetical protein
MEGITWAPVSVADLSWVQPLGTDPSHESLLFDASGGWRQEAQLQAVWDAGANSRDVLVPISRTRRRASPIAYRLRMRGFVVADTDEGFYVLGAVDPVAHAICFDGFGLRITSHFEELEAPGDEAAAWDEIISVGRELRAHELSTRSLLEVLPDLPLPDSPDRWSPLSYEWWPEQVTEWAATCRGLLPALAGNT